MDSLEDLDNKTLRAKCIEFGLPNVPITDTSRKLLIKRLRAAIENSGKASSDNKTAEKQKNRRETVHVVRVETATVDRSKSKEKSKSPSRRRTIDTNIPIASNTSAAPAPAQITQRRRSGRITPDPVQPKPVLSENVKSKFQKTTIAEESEDVVLIEDDTSSRPGSRASRSSSLSTSPVVSITYSEQAKSTIPEEEDIQVGFVQPSYTQNIERKSVHSYEIRKPYVPPATSVTTRESLYPSLKDLQSSHPPLTSTGPVRTLFDSSLGARRRETTIGYGGTSSAAYGIAYGGTSNIGYGGKAASSSTRSKSFYTPQDNSEDEEPDEIEKNAPYLSDFTRKLSKLKAEPINVGVSKFGKEVYQPKDFLATRRSARIDSRLAKQPNSVGESMKQLWLALDQKYGLKMKFYIVSGIVLLIFIYSFLYK